MKKNCRCSDTDRRFISTDFLFFFMVLYKWFQIQNFLFPVLLYAPNALCNHFGTVVSSNQSLKQLCILIYAKIIFKFIIATDSLSM